MVSPVLGTGHMAKIKLLQGNVNQPVTLTEAGTRPRLAAIRSGSACGRYLKLRTRLQTHPQPKRPVAEHQDGCGAAGAI